MKLYRHCTFCEGKDTQHNRDHIGFGTVIQTLEHHDAIINTKVKLFCELVFAGPA